MGNIEWRPLSRDICMPSVYHTVSLFLDHAFSWELLHIASASIKVNQVMFSVSWCHIPQHAKTSMLKENKSRAHKAQSLTYVDESLHPYRDPSSLLPFLLYWLQTSNWYPPAIVVCHRRGFRQWLRWREAAHQTWITHWGRIVTINWPEMV